MTDKEFLDYVANKKKITYRCLPQEIKDFLLSRFCDFTYDDEILKMQEAKYRIENGIEEVPKCENCGQSVKYIRYFFASACCDKCKKILANKRLEKTSLKKYGHKRPSQSKQVKEKQKETVIQKYGSVSALNNEKIKQKTKQTLLCKYGVDNIAKSDYWKRNVMITSQEKYGTDYPNQSELVKSKMKQTCIEHYGVDNFFKTKEARTKAISRETLNKSLETKRKNHTFNTSKIEIESFNTLKEKFTDAIYQYKDKERYPFVCDFYIPSMDTFIECNYHWTHGGKPYKGTENDLNLIKEWKSTNSQYYNNAITTWTIRDVKKRNIAKENNLKFLEFYTFEDFKEWLNEQ